MKLDKRSGVVLKDMNRIAAYLSSSLGVENRFMSKGLKSPNEKNGSKEELVHALTQLPFAA
jgi:hypothetical protein